MWSKYEVSFYYFYIIIVNYSFKLWIEYSTPKIPGKVVYYLDHVSIKPFTPIAHVRGLYFEPGPYIRL